MARRALVLVAATMLFLSACGGSSQSSSPDLSNPLPNGPGSNGAGSGGSPDPAPTTTGSPNPTNAKIKEKPVNDTLRGGIAIGTDNLLYASGQIGLQVIDQQLNVIPAASTAQAQVEADTWPAVPKTLHASGPVASAGGTVNALAVLPTPLPASAVRECGCGAVPKPTSRPALAQYNVESKTWFNVTLGELGDLWVSLASPGGTSIFVVGDHLTTSGWVGFLKPFGIGCVAPTFTQPLGASAIGPDGNLWVATDPSLNSKNASDSKNPSILYDINTSTGAIVKSFTLPAGSHIASLASGTNAMWFTDDGLGDIGMAPLEGTNVTLLPLPNNGKAQKPVGISADNFGGIWFSEFNGKRIGYIDPVTQKMTFFKVNGLPLGVVACVPGQTCPQQNVFFAEVHAVGDAAF